MNTLGCCVALALLAPAACSSPTASRTPAAGVQELEARLEAIRRDLKVTGMSAAIVQDGAVSWSRGFGFADREAGVAATPATSYHLASLTKTFAATVLLQLVEEGKLDLEAPVADFGIDLPGVRVKHLLSHTSAGTPGAAFHYDGDRFALLDRVVAVASGRSFAELVVERIVLPLGLSATAPNVQNAAAFGLTGYDPAAFAGNLAAGYTSDGSGRQAYPGHFSTAAGLISSVLDMAAYSQALDADRLLRRETRDRAWTPTLTPAGAALPYGLGWFVTDYRGVKVVWHYGYWTANSSLIVKVPERGLTFVVLANTDGLSRPFNLGAGDLLSSPLAREFLEAFVR